jgi:hypothetical protein
MGAGLSPFQPSATPSGTIVASRPLGAATGGSTRSTSGPARGEASFPTSERAATRTIVPGAGSGSRTTTSSPGVALRFVRRPCFSMSPSPSSRSVSTASSGIFAPSTDDRGAM